MALLPLRLRIVRPLMILDHIQTPIVLKGLRHVTAVEMAVVATSFATLKFAGLP